MLRPRFLAADVGITGANFLVAETGSSIIVTNEGNGDLTQTLPRVHIVVASLEKLVPTLEDAATLLRLLARSATGQEFSSYTTVSTGPRRPGDLDGPEQYHVVLLDNGRSAMLGGEFQDMLRCIRCAACLNHCPVYAAVGGHAYGWVYPGPMGAVLTPSADRHRRGRRTAQRLDLLRALRKRLPGQDPAAEDDAALARARIRAEAQPRECGEPGCRLWAWVARRPALYHALAEIASRGARLGRRASRPVPQPAVRRRLDRGARSCRRPRAAASTACGPSGETRAHKMSGARGRKSSPASAARCGAGRSTDRPRPSCARGSRRIAATSSRRARRRSTMPGGSSCSSAMAEAVQTTVTRVAVGRGGARTRWRAISPPRTCRPSWSWRPIRASTTSRGTTRPLLRIRRGRAEPEDAVSLTPCFAAVAETGTLMLVSGAETPTTLNFLPDTHIVVLRAGQVVASYEDGWDRLRAATVPAAPAPGLPRTVNFITGPSRTGDIEQRIELGAHGPRRLHIVARRRSGTNRTGRKQRMARARDDGAAAHRDRALWAEAIRDVTPLPGRPAGPVPPPGRRPARAEAGPPPDPVQPPLDRFAGIDRANAERLKRGLHPIEARLDLHGMTQAEAHRALADFVVGVAPGRPALRAGDHRARPRAGWAGGAQARGAALARRSRAAAANPGDRDGAAAPWRRRRALPAAAAAAVTG